MDKDVPKVVYMDDDSIYVSPVDRAENDPLNDTTTVRIHPSF
jgi:hypothetical protein